MACPAPVGEQCEMASSFHVRYCLLITRYPLLPLLITVITPY